MLGICGCYLFICCTNVFMSVNITIRYEFLSVYHAHKFHSFSLFWEALSQFFICSSTLYVCVPKTLPMGDALHPHTSIYRRYIYVLSVAKVQEDVGSLGCQGQRRCWENDDTRGCFLWQKLRDRKFSCAVQHVDILSLKCPKEVG